MLCYAILYQCTNHVRKYVTHAQIVLMYYHILHEEHKRTPNYDLSSAPSQGLIVMHALHINFQMYFHKLEAFIMKKHVQTMYSFIVLTAYD